jgi:ketopantoate reductase
MAGASTLRRLALTGSIQISDEGGARTVPMRAGLFPAAKDPAASGSHLASTLQDLLNGRPTEIAHLNGAIASRAQVHGVPAPANALITQLVYFLEASRPRRVDLGPLTSPGAARLTAS